MTNAYWKRICLWVCVAALCVPALSCFAAADAPVRVGYFSCGDYFHPQADGGVESYDAAYLQALSAYTDLTYTFVDCGTWANAMRMLENREIDLLGTMLKNTKRDQRFSICQSSYGVTATELVALPDSAMGFEDFEAVNGARLGVLRNYVRIADVTAYLNARSLHPTFAYYETQEDLFAALTDGRVDVIAASSHTIPVEWKVVAKFAYAKFYFATWSGNAQLTNKLDEALIKLELYRAQLQTELQTRYFPGLMTEPYSVAELAFVAGQPALNVYVNDDSEPLSYRDAAGEMTGILVDLCEMIERETGLTFAYHALAERGVSAEGETSIVVNVPDTGTPPQAAVSDSFFTMDFLLYCRLGNALDAGADGAYTVALPQNRQSYIDYLTQIYPNCRMRILRTPEACVRAVSTGKADLTMLSSYLVDNICKRKDIDNLVALPSVGIPMSFSLILEGDDAAALTEIIDKGIERLDAREIGTMQIAYALGTTPDNTLAYFVRHNAALLIIVSALLMLAVCVCIYARILSRSNRAIQKANKAKSEFLSTMSHDIRTPMNAIINIARLAQDDYDSGGDVRDDLRQISSVSSFLMGLLNDVLDMSSIESGKFQLRPEAYAYEEFLAYLGSIFDTLCEQKHIRFVREPGETKLTLWVDKVRFNQIFFNLLSNAVKFTPEGGTVTYAASDHLVENGYLTCTFTVSDTGCGMSEDFQKRMFEPFEQEQDNKNAYQGTGLGLSIVKNIVALMGGEIAVKSAPGQGASFYVRLRMPIATDEQIAAAGGRYAPTVSIEGCRVLVVEDNNTNVIVLTRFLAKKGVVCAVARDGAEGLAMFLRSEINQYDLILMDLRMPVMGGIEATKRIRAANRPDAKTVPILAMTADAFDNDVEATKAAGMNAHLTKPVVAETLYRAVGQYGAHHRGKDGGSQL